MRPRVSIVVTTRNEEGHIRNCLMSIRSQDYSNIELIVVDNNSSDDTKEIAREFTNNVFNHGPERSSQRNLGLLKKSTGEYLVYIDADMLLSADLISRCVLLIESLGDRCVGLHIDEMVLGRSWLAAVRRFERSFYTGTVIDGARFFRRNAFFELGGFDEELPPGTEDWDLDTRLKQLGAILVVPNKSAKISSRVADYAFLHGIKHATTFRGVFHNESAMTLTTYFAKKRYYKNSVNAYIEKWGSSHPTVRKQLGFVYRFIVVFVEGGKWRKLVGNPLLSTSMLILRIAVGFQFLLSKHQSDGK